MSERPYIARHNYSFVSLILLFLLCTLPAQGVCAALQFTDDFENDSSFYRWQITNPPGARLQSEYVFSGSRALALNTAQNCVAIQSLMLHRTSEILQKGFYTHVCFMLVPETGPLPQQPREWAMFFFYGMLDQNDKGIGNPWVSLRQLPDGNFGLALGFRDTVGMNPLIFPMNTCVLPVSALKWYSFESYVRMRNDTLTDSIFLGYDCIFSQSIALKKGFETLKGVELGSWSWHPGTGMREIVYDNFKISESRIGPAPERPRITYPSDGEAFTGTAPCLGLDIPDQPHIDSVECAVVPENGAATQARILAKNTCVWPHLLTPDRVYSTMARARNRFGRWSSWSQPVVFASSAQPFEGDRDTAFSIRIGKIPAKGYPYFGTGDTAWIMLDMPESVAVSGYVEINVSSEKVSGSLADRWNFDTLPINWVINISLPESTSSFIRMHGVNVLADSALEGPAASMIASVYPWKLVNKDHGTVTAPFIMDKRLPPGIWYVNAQLTAKGGRTWYAAPRFFRHVPPAPGHIPRAAACVAAILAIIIIIVAVKLATRAPKETPSAMRETYEKIRAYIAENHAEKLTNEQIAAHAGLGVHRAAQICRAIANTTPMQMLILFRVNRSKELLRASAKSVNEIAYEVGFSDPNILHRNFKKIVGQTPSEYRVKYS